MKNAVLHVILHEIHCLLHIIYQFLTLVVFFTLIHAFTMINHPPPNLLKLNLSLSEYLIYFCFEVISYEARSSRSVSDVGVFIFRGN